MQPSTVINEPKTRSILSALLRAFLILFAVAGTPHLLRIVREPPSLTDLYPVWLGSRELLLDHRNPYSPEVSREIQVAFYGKELGPGDHPDQQCCFAYPAYVSFLLAPIINADFDDARRIMLFLLSALTAASVTCWHVVTRRGSSWLALTTLLVLVSPPVMQGLELRQLGCWLLPCSRSLRFWQIVVISHSRAWPGPGDGQTANVHPPHRVDDAVGDPWVGSQKISGN